jgi:hypothetical protein
MEKQTLNLQSIFRNVTLGLVDNPAPRGTSNKKGKG